MKNLLHTEPLFKIMALNAIVDKMVEDGNESSILFECLAYMNEGSSISGVDLMWYNP